MRRTCHLHCVKMVFALPFEVCSDVAAPCLGNAIALHLRDVFIKFLCCIQSGNAWGGLLEHIYIRMEPGFEKYFRQTVAAQVSAELYLLLHLFPMGRSGHEQLYFCWFRSLMLNQAFFPMQ